MADNFLVTSDEYTIDVLKQHGFQLMYGDNSSHIFLNNNRLLFDLNDDKLSYTYTNKLFI